MNLPLKKQDVCTWTSEHMVEALDHSLSEADTDRFEHHVARCECCNDEWRRYKLTASVCASLKRPRVDVSSSVRSRIELEHSGQFSVGVLWSAMGTICILLSIGFYALPEFDNANRVQMGARSSALVVDYVDANSLEPVQLDLILHRARETNVPVTLRPVLGAFDQHRRSLQKEAIFHTLSADLAQYSGIDGLIEIEEPVDGLKVDAVGSFVVAVDGGF